MDFQAVIKAILNKGDVESQLADLVKDRDVHINPTVGTSGSTNTTLNNQIKRQANAQAKSYVQYSKSAIQKQMKHASGTFYSSGETNIDKGLISRQKKQAEEMASVITDIAKNEGISDKDAKKYAKNVSKIQEKAQDQALKEQEKNNAKFQAKQKALNEKAAKIESDIQAKKFASKSSKYQKQFSGYVDNNSKEYNEFGMNVIDYDKQRKELNRMYGNFQKNRSAENRDLLIEAHAKLEQYDKNTASSLSLLNASPNKVLQSDVQKQVEKQHKEQEKQYSNWFNQALKEQEKKDKSYDANLAAQQNKLNSYYAGTQEYKNASKSFKEYEKNVQDLQKLHTQYQAKPTTANQDAIIQQNEKVIQSYEKLNNEMKILNSTQTKALNPGEGSIQANKIRTYLENNTKAAKDYGDVLEDIAKKSESATTKGELQGANQDFKKIQSEISARGLTGNSMFSEVKRGFSQISQFVGTYGILQSGMNKAQEMVQNTYDVDSAMTQLQMATSVSNDKAKDLMKTYSNMGHQLKATGTDVAASSTEWMKQGQSVEKSNKLAESSIKLSKVGGLSSEDATKYLTSARKGYGVTSAEDTLKIVDKLSSVDMASATDVGGLAEGMSEVANTAKIAGISMDKLLGYLATIGEVTQEGMGSVGTGLNAVFARMGNIKLSRLKDYQNNGEDLSNVETVLRGEGINLRDKTDQFRNFGDVLDEVAGNWNNYSDVSQRAIAQSFAGTHHMNEFITLMTNYGKAQEYEKVSENSAGSTDKKYKVYENSLEGRTEDLKNSFQSISTTFADKNLLGGGITLLSNVLNVVNKLVSSFGLLQTAAAGFAGIKLFKNLG